MTGPMAMHSGCHRNRDQGADRRAPRVPLEQTKEAGAAGWVGEGRRTAGGRDPGAGTLV